MPKSPIKISEMTGKLAGLQAVNSNPLTNPFCQTMAKVKGSICSHCYSCSMLNGYRRNCIPAFEHNGKLLSAGLIPENQHPVFKTDLVRFHAHGELINLDHLLNLWNIAISNPTKTFGFWTKRKDLLKQAYDLGAICPPNVIMIYSNPAIDKPIKPPRYFNKSFNVVSDNNGVNCGAASCNTCRKCYQLSGPSVIVEQLK
jgi:hypothetical protein